MKHYSELEALIRLLDDTDHEVARHVSEKLATYGKPIIPRLEDIWEGAFNPELQERIEHIIQRIQFDHTIHQLEVWLNSEEQTLLEGALIVSKFQYPELDTMEVVRQIDRIQRNIWLELNDFLSPIEEINVFNQVFYRIHGINGGNLELNEPQTYYLNSLLDSKKGNSYSMGILYLLIAEQLDLPVYGICLPHHFTLVFMKHHIDRRFQAIHELENEVVFYINPLSNGMIFTRSEIQDYLSEMNIPPSKDYFVPASNKQIIGTLIENLTDAYEMNNALEKASELKKMLKIIHHSE